MTATPLELSTALGHRVVGDGILLAEITKGWDVRDRPHGGFLLALVTEAMASVVPQPDPLTVSATYLAIPDFGEAEMRVEAVRVGKRQSTAAVRLIQDGVERVRAVATFGHLPESAPYSPAGSLARPELPPPGECLPMASAVADADGEGPIRLHERLDLRLDPNTGWIHDRPRGDGVINGWMRLADGGDVDTSALLVLSDGMPPSIFEAAGRDVGHVPTLQLTTHLFARPTTEWIQATFRTTVRNGAYIDEDGEMWDETGRLVGTARQLALLLPPPA